MYLTLSGLSPAESAPVVQMLVLSISWLTGLVAQGELVSSWNISAKRERNEGRGVDRMQPRCQLVFCPCTSDSFFVSVQCYPPLLA